VKSGKERLMREVFICDAARTAIGRYGGVLAKVRTDDLAAIPIRALVARNSHVDWSRLDEVFFGCANQAGEDNRNLARMALLLAGLPDVIPGVTINRLCASGLNAVGDAARAIRSGEMDFAIAGGVESMTRAPFVMGKAAEPFARAAEIYDTTLGWRFINPALKAQYGVDSMAETGENVAEEFQVARKDQDAFALRSQQRAARAIAAGYFAQEIVPLEAPGGKAGPILVDKDEHPRPDTTLDNLQKLKPIVRHGGTITAGNASGINDGAAAIILACAEAVRAHGLTPRARVLGMASAAVPPRIMGIGPVPSTRKLMQRLGLKIGDFDLIEINEAFASQGLACLRQLGVADDAEHVNPHGGAIALGHPLGMSGARLTLTAVHGLEKRGGTRALATMCVGVGQGVSLALERV
jgi:3-oxoadipyl-CoA thiolase